MTSAIRWTAGLCSLSGCSGWWGPCQRLFCPHNPGGLDQRAERVEPADQGRVQGPVRQDVRGEWLVGSLDRFAFGLRVARA